MYNHLHHHTTTRHLCFGAHGHLSADCGPVPTACSTDLPARYRLLDIEQLAGCPACTVATEGRAWDGTFFKPSPATCHWQPQNADGYGASPGERLRIGSSVLAATALQLIAPPDEHWLLYIDCETDGGTEPLWFGRKNTGQTPLGTYTRVMGWFATETMTVH